MTSIPTSAGKLVLFALAPGMVALLALAVVFAPSTTTTSVFAGEGGGCPANPSPPDPADPSIVVEAPAHGAIVSSPVTIAGQARTFEANVRIRILDQAGATIVDTFTTAAEAGPALAPFSASVAFEVAAMQPGCIEVFEESAEDGSAINVVQVPVTLQAPEATPVPVAPPATGTGAEGTGGSIATIGLLLLAAGLVVIVSVPSLALARRRR